MGVIFWILTLVTGSIWARTSLGVWWSWGERQLVLFLVLFLFYWRTSCCATRSSDRGASGCRRSTRFGVVLIPAAFHGHQVPAEGLSPSAALDRDHDNLAASQLTTFVRLAATLALAAASPLH